MKKTALAALMIASFLPSSNAATYYLTVAGLGGEEEYTERFTTWAKEFDALFKKAGTSANVETLYGEAVSKQAVREALGRIAGAATPDDAVVVCLIGHGTFDGFDYKFNVPGPDVTAAEIAGWLDKIQASRQLIVNTTSASGASLEALRGPKRVVITATKSGTEKNATIFARYWAEALRDAGADTDKNETVSALEAFRYAEQKTAGFYQSQKRLATEHAIFEDTGKGEGVRAPAAENGQGALASSFTVVRYGAAGAAANDPAKRDLLAKKEQLEQSIDKLKYEKAALPADDYRKRMTQLLMDLARTQQELDK